MAHRDVRVEVRPDEERAVTTVSGDLDMVVADALDAALNEIADDADVLVDLSAVDFMDSSGLAVVLRQSIRRRDAGGSLYVRPSDPVRRLLVFCCLEHLFDPAGEAT